VRLHVLESRGDPSGGSFLLVHGLASNARLWDGVRDALVARGAARVVAVDLRGHGRSEKPDDGYDVATVADDLADLIDALELHDVVVAGQSWGGNVVLDLVARDVATTRVRAAVLVDGGWIDLSHFATWDQVVSVMAPPRSEGTPYEQVASWVRGAHPDWPESGIQGALACFEVREDGTVAPWLTYDRHLQVLRGLWEHRPSSLYPSVKVPVVLVPSNALRREAVEAAARAIPVCEVRWFDADHDVHAQHPDEIASVLLDAYAMGS
jgi:pimeloyl-ACP methyl ester carboxylesterase